MSGEPSLAAGEPSLAAGEHSLAAGEPSLAAPALSLLAEAAEFVRHVPDESKWARRELGLRRWKLRLFRRWPRPCTVDVLKLP
jgi:uncharacterized RDD family membrane protein YckC